MSNMTAKRELALYHLRINPQNRKQGRTFLYNPESDTYCALGLLGEAFGYDVVNSYASEKIQNSIYTEMCKALGIWSSWVYIPNDVGKTFSEIAAELEQLCKQYPDGAPPESDDDDDSDTAEEDY